jgi:hypothetical protein
MYFEKKMFKNFYIYIYVRERERERERDVRLNGQL